MEATCPSSTQESFIHLIDLETQAPNGAHHALYARFSSALQKPRSIEEHVCRLAKRHDIY